VAGTLGNWNPPGAGTPGAGTPLVAGTPWELEPPWGWKPWGWKLDKWGCCQCSRGLSAPTPHQLYPDE